jgi:MraZ protein
MFRGRSKHILDSKGRLAIPARFRDVIERNGDNCLVLTNHENCLWAFAREDWKSIEEKASGLSQFDERVNVYRRYFISGAVECYIKQQRITIPQDLREIAGLKKEAVLVGQLKLFEIWDKERWEQEFDRVRKRFSEVTQSLAELGI